jgi:5'-3' exonuclease
MRLHLVDGTFELFRAHHSKRPGHRAPDGSEAKATVGLAASLAALLNDPSEAVTHVAVAFDNPIRSFRNALYAGYKGDEGVEPELRAQFDAAEEAARALGLVVWSMRDHEADDALATGAARFGGAVEQVRLLTPDKDLGQCLAGRRVVQVDRIRGREIDEDALVARRGVRPASIPDWLALVGDAADGYPGLPGFGERTATALLSRHGRLEDIPADPARWPPEVRGAARLAEVLGERRADALLFRRLATLVADVPLAESLDDLRFGGIPRQRFDAWCEALGARTLREALRGRSVTRWAP